MMTAMVELNALFGTGRTRTSDAAADAASLLAAWRRVERTHLPISFGCSCGAMGHVRVQDFERDVLDYLNEKHAANAQVVALLQRFAIEDNGRGGAIAALLQGLADDPAGGDADARRALVADLRRSIGSWSRVLGPASEG